MEEPLGLPRYSIRTLLFAVFLCSVALAASTKLYMAATPPLDKFRQLSVGMTQPEVSRVIDWPHSIGIQGVGPNEEETWQYPGLRSAEVVFKDGKVQSWSTDGWQVQTTVAMFFAAGFSVSVAMILIFGARWLCR